MIKRRWSAAAVFTLIRRRSNGLRPCINWILIVMSARLLVCPAPAVDSIGMLDIELEDLTACSVKGDVETEVNVQYINTNCEPNYANKQTFYVNNFTVERVCGSIVNETIPRQLLNITWQMNEINNTDGRPIELEDVSSEEGVNQSLTDTYINHRADVTLDVKGHGRYLTWRICISISTKMQKVVVNQSLLFSYDCLILKDGEYHVGLHHNLADSSVHHRIKLSSERCLSVITPAVSMNYNSTNARLPAAPAHSSSTTNHLFVIIIIIVFVVACSMATLVVFGVNILKFHERKRPAASLEIEAIGRLPGDRASDDQSMHDTTQEGEPMLIPPDLSYL